MRLDPVTLEPIKDPVIFIHYVLGGRQAGHQMVTDVTELKCCHVYSRDTVDRLRREAANTYHGRLHCPECRLEVHIVQSLPGFGEVPMPQMPARDPVHSSSFEEVFRAFMSAAAAPAADAADAAAAESEHVAIDAAAIDAAAAAAPAPAEFPAIVFMPAAADAVGVPNYVDAPAYTPTSPPYDPLAADPVIIQESDDEEEQGVADEDLDWNYLPQSNDQEDNDDFDRGLQLFLHGEA